VRQAMGLYDMTFYDLICRNAVCHKNRLAWLEVDDNRELTFAQYKDQVTHLASGLQRLGIRQNDRIGVLGKNSLEYFLLYGAAGAIGAVMLPVNWRLSSNEIAFNLNDCGPRIIFADPEFHATINDCRKNVSAANLFCSLKSASEGYDDFNSLMANDGDFTPADVSSDDSFVIIHTAAVAGRPRGAVLSHGNVLCSNMHFQYHLNLTRKDVHLNFLPMFHIAGLLSATSAFHAGAPNVNMSKFDAAKVVDLIEEKNVSFFFEFTPVLSSILEQQAKSGKSIRALKAVIGLDVPETIEKYQKISGGTYYCFYGQTETSCLATVGSYNERPGAAGQPILLGDVRLVNDHDRPVSAGQTGEIVLRGPMVFRGYWNLPDDNAHTFRNGWHHTGDLGRFDQEGFLWYSGRKAEKELIKPGGENVYPAEVENVILQHPAIEKCVVIGVPDPKWKEGIKAVCQLKAAMSLTAEELIKFVGSKIASYKKPQYVQFVPEIPLLDGGAPDRAKIKELYGVNTKNN
jgi:acyl-CoA synthetase (AMP-forming)/AMP-acid ligase II